MNTLTKSDLNFVLSRCPKDIRNKLKKHASYLFLAGGFIRSTISGEPVSDVDLFGESKEALLAIAKDLALDRRGRYFTTDNAITVLAPPRHPVQLITRWTFRDPCTLIESFDFTVCQAVIWAESLISPGGATYRFHSLCSESFYSDLAARRLVYTYPVREEAAGGSLMRVMKFVKKGWKIQAPSIAGVVSRLVMKLNADAISKSVGISGDSRETVVANILSGLLREVDPLILVDGVDFVDEHEVING